MNGKNIQKSSELRITVYSRLHFTLIGMHYGGYRINGGFGIALENPKVAIHSSLAKEFSLSDKREVPLSNEEISRIVSKLNEVGEKHNLKNKLNIEVSGTTKSHYGFGSGTSIRLGILESLLILNNQKYTDSELTEISGRGGTSGVGINTYFRGGAIFDLGHPSTNRSLGPSSSSEDRIQVALLSNRNAVPGWEIGICIPAEISPKRNKDEKLFFSQTCPIPDDDVYKTLYHVVYGLHAGILEKDFITFCDSVKAVQKCVWKRAEWQQYKAEGLFDIELALYDAGALAVGLSSLGPTLFFLSKNNNEIINKMKSSRFRCEYFSTYPANQGRFIEYV